MKGSKAQESIGLGVAATRDLATDSDMEQGLEVEDWVERKKALVATRVLGDGSRAGSWKEIHFGGDLEGGRHQDDGEEATAAVTQCGCRRGKDFGGCERRVRGRPRGRWKVARLEAGGGAGNGSNPMAGSRAQ